MFCNIGNDKNVADKRRGTRRAGGSPLQGPIVILGWRKFLRRDLQRWYLLPVGQNLRVFCGAVEITQILIPVGLPLIWEPFVRVLEDAEVEKQI